MRYYLFILFLSRPYKHPHYIEIAETGPNWPVIHQVEIIL